MRESILFASVRSFFLALFGMIGLTLGIIPIIILFSALISSDEGTPEINYTYNTEVLPNAEGSRKVLSTSAPVILKLKIHGVIGSETLNRHTVEKQLIESRERSLKGNRVKAILVQIDSPGGTVTDANGIFHLIKEYKEKYKVPVYAYVDGLCASGGMYAAVAADKIFASSVSLIGSVGVISPAFVNVSQLLDKVGVQALTLYEGKGKDDLNPLRPWRKNEEDNFKELILYYYNQFVNIVSANRPKLDKEKLINDYGAQVFPADQAKERGYIDETGFTLNQTIKLLAQKIGIDDDYYQVIELDNKSWYSSLFSSEFSLLKGQLKHQIVLTPETDPKLMNQFLYLYRP